MQFVGQYRSQNARNPQAYRHSKRKAHACLMGVAIAGAFAARHPVAHAADVLWSASPATSSWNTTDANWSGATWNNAPLNGAVFNTSSTTALTVTQPISTSSMDFQVGGYSIGGSSAITLGNGSSSLTGFGAYSTTSTASGGYSGIVDVTGTSSTVYNSAEIDAPVSSTVGFKKVGKGLLTLGGALNITGSYPITGSLTYTTGAYFLPAGNALLTTNLAVGGTTPPSSSSTVGTAGGILRLTSTASIPTTTTVSVGDGLLDLGSNNITIAGLTFVNQASTYNTWTAGPSDPLIGGYGNGVIGSGTLTVNGDINVIYPQTAPAGKNTIESNLNIGSGGTVIRIASGSTSTTATGLLISGNLSGAGAVTVVPGYTSNGAIVSVGSQYGGMALFGTNTNTGPMTIATANTYVTGTNSASSLTVTNSAVVQLIGSNGSFGNAGSITIGNNGTLALLSDTAYTTVGTGAGGTTSGTANAAVNNNRISDSANIVMHDATFTYNAASGQTCSETYGSLNLSAGANVININIPNVSTLGGSAALTANSLNIGPTATLQVNSFYQMGNSAQHFFNSVTDAATGTNYVNSQAIIPRVITYTANTQNYDLAYYDPVNGLSTYNGYSPDNTLTGDASVTGALSSISSTAINSLRVNNANGYSFALSLDGNSSTTLTISSGMILVNKGYVTFQGNGNKSQIGTLNFGSAAGVVIGNSGYYVTSYLPITGTGGLIISGPSFYAYGSLGSLAGGITVNGGTAYLYEGQGVNGTVSTYATPGPINIRNGSASILYTSLLPNGSTNSTATTTFTEPTGLGDVTLGEPENNNNLINDFLPSNTGPSATLIITGVGNSGTVGGSGSVFTRNINFNNGGSSNAGAALQPAFAANFPQVVTAPTGTTESITGNIRLFSPGTFTDGGAGSPTSYSSVGPNFSGTISGSGTLAFIDGTYNLTGTLATTGPIWISPTLSANLSFMGNAYSTSTSPIVGWGGGKKSVLAYSGQSSLPNNSITISNTSTTGASAGINDFTLRPLNTSTITNTININSDTTFNAPAAVIGTWAGLITGSSALYVAGGTLVPTNTGNTFNGPLTVNGTTAVLSLANGTLKPATISVTSGTLAAQGTITAPLNITGGTLYPGYGTTTPQSLTLPTTFSLTSASTINLNLTGLSGTTGINDQLVFTSAPAFAGTLNVYNVNGTNLVVGDSFQIFNYSGFTPTASYSNPVNLPALGANEVWSTAALYQANGSNPAGTISIVAGITSPDAWNNSTGVGNWEVAGNWTLPGGYPGGYGSTEGFGDVAGLTGPATVILTAPESSGTILFNSSTGLSYTLQGASLTMYNSSSSAAAISVATGAQTISSNVSFFSTGLNINVASGSISFGGNVSGPGPLNLAGSTTFAGPLSAGATSVSGTATFNGPLTLGAVTTAAGSVLNFGSSGTQTIGAVSLNGGAALYVNSGSVITSGALSTTSGNVLNVSGGALFSGTSFTFTASSANVAGSMNLSSSSTLTAATITIQPGGKVYDGSSITMNAGSSLVDNGSFNSGSSAVTLNTGSTLNVGTGAYWRAALTINNTGSAYFAGQSSGSSVYPVFVSTLTTAAGSKLVLGSSNSSVDRTFLFAGSTYALLAGGIDLGNGDFVDGTAYSYEGSSGYTLLNNMLKIGFNGGAWNGSSSTTAYIYSSAAASDQTRLHALGIALNDTGANTGASTGTMLYPNFDNFLNSSFNSSSNTIVSADVLIKYTYYGDANLDGRVDGSDYSLIDNGYLKNLTGWYNGDFNYDGVVNGSDYALIDNAYNSQGTAISAQIASPTDQVVGSGGTSVPEPASLALLGIGAVGLLGRRRFR